MENREQTIWEILGIAKTRDEKKITQAYREKLSLTNPEDKPEEFKQLRQAYEEALAYARSNTESKEDDGEVNNWLARLQDTYNDFSKRCRVECWEELFNSPLLESIAGKARIEEELLHFLMDYYFLGHEVWLCMERHFSFLERKEELYEKYPRDFIDRVIINGIIYQDILPPELFVPGKDGEECHRYLDVYLNLQMDASCREVVEELSSLKESHPYGEALSCCWKVRFEDHNYIDELQKIAEKYDLPFIYLLLAREYYALADYEKAETICKKQLEIHKDDMRMRYLYVDVLEAKKDLDEAMKQINDMMGMVDGDSRLLNELNERRIRINPFIIENKKKVLESDPDDEQAKIDLCWAYLENDLGKEALAVFETINKEKITAFDYYNLLSSLTYISKDYEKGTKALEKLIEVIDELPEDSDKNIRRKKRKGEMYNRLAYFHHMNKDDETMKKAYGKALEVSESKASIYTSMAQMAMSMEEYDSVEEYSQKIIAEKPDSVYGHVLLAYAYFYCRNDQEAYNEISRVIDMDSSDLNFFILKIRILIRNDAFEEAESIIAYLDSCGLSEDASVLYVKGLLSERKDNDQNKANEFYTKALEKMGEYAGNYEFTDDLYYRILCIAGESLNGNIKEDRDRMMELCEKGLSYRSSNKDLLEYKGWLLLKERKIEDSLKIYKDLEKDADHSAYVDAQIAYLYYQDLAHKAKESRDYYLKALERGYDRGAHFYLGMCEMYMGHLDEAEQHFEILKQQEPDSIDPYLRLSDLYEFEDRLPEALAYIDKVLEIIKDRKDDVTYYYLNKVQILRRMNRPLEAIEVLKFMAEKLDYKADKMIFDIYMQFGMFDKAEKEIWNWKWDQKYYDASATLDLLKGNFRKAKQTLQSRKEHFDKVRYLILAHALAMEEGDYKQEEVYLKQWLDPQPDGRFRCDLSQVAAHLSYCYFHQGDQARQKEYAELALEEVDKQLQEYSLNKTLFMTRKVRILALLGRFKEAEELAEKVRKSPLCEQCPYNSCKDLFAFEMEMADIKGDKDKTLQMAIEGNKRWPDEEDFVVMKNYLEKKGKKEC